MKIIPNLQKQKILYIIYQKMCTEGKNLYVVFFFFLKRMYAQCSYIPHFNCQPYNIIFRKKVKGSLPTTHYHTNACVNFLPYIQTD